MRFAILLVFVALAVTAIMAKDLRAETTEASTAAPTTPVSEASGSTVSGATEASTASQATGTTEDNGASSITSSFMLLLSVAICLIKF